MMATIKVSISKEMRDHLEASQVFLRVPLHLKVSPEQCHIFDRLLYPTA